MAVMETIYIYRTMPVARVDGDKQRAPEMTPPTMSASKVSCKTPIQQLPYTECLYIAACMALLSHFVLLFSNFTKKP